MNMSEKDSYTQKYLDQQFKSIMLTLDEIRKDVKDHQITSTKTLQEILLKIGQLEYTDKQQSSEIRENRVKLQSLERTHQEEYEKLHQAISQNNFFSVRGVLFVVGIFSVMMTAFLLNGTELIKGAL
jgi:hypothetical protein